MPRRLFLREVNTTSDAETSPIRQAIIGQSSTHISALDGVRGLAILAVFSAHFGGGRHFESPAMRAVGELMVSGWAGVDLFFVLSGFLITGILFRTDSDPHYYRSFYWRRILRVFPIYYLTLIAAFLISVAMKLPWRPDQYSFFLFANNIAVVFDDDVGVVGPALILKAFWSLAVEEQFYLFWPFLIRAAVRRGTLFWLFFGAILGALLLRTLAVYLGSPNAAYNLLFTRMDALAAGGLLAFLYRRGTLEGVSQRVPLGLLALSVIGFFTIGLLEGTLGWNTVLMSTIGFDLTALGAFSLIWLALIPRSPAQVICQAAPLRFFGRYSYGMYVYHQILQSYMMQYIFPATTRLFHSQILGAFGYFVCVLFLITAASVLSYELFEIRFLRLKRLFRSGAYSRAESGAPNLPAIASETKSY